MFWRFPGSNEVKTLPAGKPSPEINSYILQDGGYYALGPVDGKNIYLKDTPDLQVVPKDAPDESSYFSTLWNWYGDGLENTVKDVERYAGYGSEGFKKATGDLKEDLTGFGGDLRNILLAGVALLVLMLVFTFTSKFN